MLLQGNVPAVGSWHLLLRDCREAAAASTTLLRAAVTQLPAHLHGQGQMLGGIISTALQLGSFSHVEEKLLCNGQGSSKRHQTAERSRIPQSTWEAHSAGARQAAGTTAQSLPSNFLQLLGSQLHLASPAVTGKEARSCLHFSAMEALRRLQRSLAKNNFKKGI